MRTMRTLCPPLYAPFVRANNFVRRSLLSRCQLSPRSQFYRRSACSSWRKEHLPLLNLQSNAASALFLTWREFLKFDWTPPPSSGLLSGPFPAWRRESMVAPVKRKSSGDRLLMALALFTIERPQWTVEEAAEQLRVSA